MEIEYNKNKIIFTVMCHLSNPIFHYFCLSGASLLLMNDTFNYFSDIILLILI